MGQNKSKKDKSVEATLQAIGIALIVASIKWMHTNPIDAGVAIVIGLGSLYSSIHWRNVKTSISPEEAKNIVDEVGDYIEEKYRNK